MILHINTFSLFFFKSPISKVLAILIVSQADSPPSLGNEKCRKLSMCHSMMRSIIVCCDKH